MLGLILLSQSGSCLLCSRSLLCMWLVRDLSLKTWRTWCTMSTSLLLCFIHPPGGAVICFSSLQRTKNNVNIQSKSSVVGGLNTVTRPAELRLVPQVDQLAATDLNTNQCECLTNIYTYITNGTVHKNTVNVITAHTGICQINEAHQ